MPELGEYARYVLSAYGGAIALLVGIVVLSVVRARRVRDQLEEVERGVRRDV